MKLAAQMVEKPWGRTRLPSNFASSGGKRIGEIWFDSPERLPLLAKYIFTDEKLSIQVHPDDVQARERGLPSGKTECWFILAAEERAEIGVGLTRKVRREELRAAALDGSIEGLLDWRRVRQGDFFYVPAGTVHAIGAGVSLIEFQQNADITYRLYDYGRPRDLHLDDGIAVAQAEPFSAENAHRTGCGSEQVLLDGARFSLIMAQGGSALAARLQDRRRWVLPLSGAVAAGGDRGGAGDCLLLNPGEPLRFGDGAVALIGVEGSASSG